MRKLHLWLSIPSGILISLICLTGAMLVFQQELLELFYPERYYITKSGALPKMDLDQMVDSVNKMLVSDTITSIKVFSDPKRTFEASLSSAPRSSVFINPYTGDITGYYNARSGFFHKVMTLHRWLMMKDRPTGKLIVGISTIFLILILISGIVRWWRSKGFVLRKKVSFNRRLFDLHQVLGFYATLILLVCALTGLLWSFNWYRNGVAALFGIKTEQVSNNKEHRGGHTHKSETARSFWQSAYHSATESLSDFEYVRIEKNGTITVLQNTAPHPRATDSYKYNRKEKSISPIAKYGENRNMGYLMTWAYAIHVGNWAGAVSKWLTFIAALIGASLPITGYILYFRKWIVKKRAVRNLKQKK